MQPHMAVSMRSYSTPKETRQRVAVRVRSPRGPSVGLVQGTLQTGDCYLRAVTGFPVVGLEPLPKSSRKSRSRRLRRNVICTSGAAIRCPRGRLSRRPRLG